MVVAALAALISIRPWYVPGAAAAVLGIEALIRGEMTVRPLQEFHEVLRP